MKVLILSCNTGQGHNTAGKAVKEAFERRGICCEMRDALAFFSETTSKMVCDTYIHMATDAPKVFGKLYSAGEFISNPKVKSPVYLANLTCAPKMGRYIRENGFDAVITPHIFPAQTLTHLRKHGQIEAKTFFIATDYTCYPFSEETDLDAYFIAHPALIQEYVERGVPRERLIPTGIPVSSRFAEHASRTEARATLNVDPEKKLFLIMTGSMGSGGAASVAGKIAADGPENSLIYVLTGRNEAMKREVDAMSARDGRIVAVPFTTEVPLYMSAADVLITKPGGLTTTEAAAARIPLVLGAPIPGCETANARFFEKKGMAINAADAAETACAAIELIKDGERRETMLRAQGLEINAQAAESICDAVVEACAAENAAGAGQ